MDSMELDFDDLDNDDPIEKFLRHKLEEIRSANASLIGELRARNVLLHSSMQHKFAKFGTGVQLMRMWKCAFNSKCVLGITAEAIPSCKYEFMQLELSWNSPSPLTYSVKVYNKNELDEWGPSGSIGECTIVLAALERPPFHRQISFTLTGLMKYRDGQNVYQTGLSSFCVYVGDFVDPPLPTRFDHSQLPPPLANEEFLTHLVASDVVEFVGRTKERHKPEVLLEIDCRLRKLEVTSRKKYFAVEGVSPSIDGCLLVLEDGVGNEEFYFSVCSRTREQLTFLLHYLHRSVEGLSILPKSCEAHLRKSALSFDVDGREEGEKIRRDFRGALLQEIGHLEDFFAAGENRDHAKFRKDLSELEIRTDVLRVECNVPSNK